MFRRRRRDADFSAELRAHLAIEADQLREDGLDDAEALRRAHINVGSLMIQQERFYEASRWAGVDRLHQDVRYALRQLRNAPAFTATAVLTLAIGIGATTAMYTLIHAVLLKSLPVTRPRELLTAGDAKHTGVYQGMAVDWDIFSYDLYSYLRHQTERTDGPDGFADVAAFQGTPRRVGVRRAGSAAAAEAFFAQYVSGNYFSTFGVPAFAGRVIDASDDRAGAAPVAILAYRTWQQNYAMDPSVVGTAFQINGTPATVIGVAPPGFFGDALRSESPDFWLPLAAEPAVNRGGWLNNPDLHWLYLMGRLRPGANVSAIEARMQVSVRQWLTGRVSSLGPNAAAQISRQTLHLRPGATGIGLMRATYSTGLTLLMAISAFVLLIVCANLANLMLVRRIARRRQTSISLALGAGHSRLVQQAIVESLVLGLIGGLAGVAVAFAGTRALLAAVFAGANSTPISPTPDLAVLAFALSVSFAAALLFGAAPAWTMKAVTPAEALSSSRGSTARTGTASQKGLVVVQASLSLILLAVAGLLTQSLWNLQRQRFGFATGGRVAVRIDPNLAGYKVEELDSLYRRIRDRLGRLPGATGVSYALYSPMSGSNWTTDVEFEGRPPTTFDGENLTSWNRVGPDYFETVGTRIVRGRSILESDTATARHVAVVNEAFVRRFYPNEDPMGRHFGARANFAKAFEIVGIAEDAKYGNPGQPTFPMYFLSRPQVTAYDDPATMSFESRSLYVNDIVLRFTSGGVDGTASEAEIRRAFAEIDPNLSVIRIQPFRIQLGNQFSQEALIARMSSLFGLTALLLASIGLYGVTSYSVARQWKEIGIRVALGADRASVVRMVLRHAFTLVAIGLVAGIPLALGMGRVMETRLFGIAWYDTKILAGAVLALAAFALFATIVPARRAASVDPVEALRAD